MYIYGLDFTSAPTPRKPITLVSAILAERSLFVQHCRTLDSFSAFEEFLRTPGPWLCACDFPLGLPRLFLTNVDWPLTWSAYVELVARMNKDEFEQILNAYRLPRQAGDKLHLRATDKLAGACSPMMLQRVPVAKMFFQGAPRLLASGVCIPPLSVHKDERIVLEGYPALVARAFLGRQSYKSDERAHQTPQRLLARQSLLQVLCSPTLIRVYGLALDLSPVLQQELLADATGDKLDALLCAIQVAWAALQPDYGIPLDADPVEGWIVDPHLRALRG